MFKATATNESVIFTDSKSKSMIEWKMNGRIIDRNKVSKFATKREIDCATHLHKFGTNVLANVGVIKGTQAQRNAKFADVLNQYSGLASMRTLNNTVRRHFDPGTEEYFKSYFYEGTAKFALKPKKTVVIETKPVAAIPKVAKVKPVAKKVVTTPKKKVVKKAKTTL